MTALIQRGLEIVPGYTLVRRVGSGMAGEVWVARASGGVHVAIKIIRDMEMVGSKRELGALRIVREIKHTNLCPLIGVWFFDHDGELLSNSATDEILGHESSLIDTAFNLDSNSHNGGLRDTPTITRQQDAHKTEYGNLSDGDSVIGTDSSFAETSDLSHFSSEGSKPFRGGRTGDQPGVQPETDSRSETPGEARQMIIAMGLGDRTLYDRLVEMRAPGNMPEEGDPMHLPGGLPVKELLQYIAGAASAIDELNLNHNIYHCDIKPQNILVVGGNAQVCDFGLARRVQENRRTQLAIGTPAYGAPEMLFDQTYTKTIDQYSLAITYYELRSGKLPFETTRRSMFLRAKAQGELQLDALSLAEQEVIAKATDLDPELRYPTCTAFVEAITEAVYSKPQVAPRVNKWAVAGAIGVGAVAIPVALFFANLGTPQTVELPAEPEQISLPVDVDEPSITPARDRTGDELPTERLGDREIEKLADREINPSNSMTAASEGASDSDDRSATEVKASIPEPTPTREDFIAKANELARKLIDNEKESSGDLSSASTRNVQGQSLIDELDQLFGDTRRTGWELIEDPLRLSAITIAGRIQWDQNQLSDALRNWISIQQEAALSESVPAIWRHAVAERTLEWLIENSVVSDQDITQHRYAKLIQRANGVLRLAGLFASDSQSLLSRIDRQRFLLAAAQDDTLNGLKLWRTQGSPSWQRSPQIGYALARLTESRLHQAKDPNERVSLLNLRVLAANIQVNGINGGPIANISEVIWKELQDCFQWWAPVVHLGTNPPLVVSDGIETAELAVFAKEYVSEAQQRLASNSYIEWVDQLSRIELAAAIAAVYSADAEVRREMRLVATESFLQSRYEHGEDVPAAKLVDRLRAYGKLVDSTTFMDRMVLARIADQNGARERRASDIQASYENARSNYTSVLEDPLTSPDVRGSAARCRASLLARIAALTKTENKAELRQATDDAQLALTLPQRWHLDQDDRWTTASEVNLAMVRLLDDLTRKEKQVLLDEADQYLDQAIAERDKRGLPSFSQATLRLNGYLLDLVHSTEGQRREDRQSQARQWMESVATEPVVDSDRLVDRTIDSPSNRLRCHWHCICSLVFRALGDSDAAMNEVRYAHRIALANLEPIDDRRHFAILSLVQLKSVPLEQSAANGERPDTKLIQELIDLLDSIVEPQPGLEATKQLYQQELSAMLR